MLADVMKEREKLKQHLIQEDLDQYNRPYKRDVVLYFSYIHIIGGIETWIKNLSKDFTFTLVYDTADKERLEYIKSLGIETIKYVGQSIECDLLIRTLFGNAQFKAKKTMLFVHGDYSKLDMDDIETIPEYDEIYAVSKVSAEGFEKATGILPKVLYNPVYIDKSIKPLVIGVFSRLSAEKGKKRIEYLIEQLKASNKPFLMFIFTDLPFEIGCKNVVFLNPVMNPSGWMEICDYICQLSDTEAGCYTMQEALKLGKPLIITKLPILEEFGINESNAKIMEFDMSNLDIDDLWNIPKVKWNEPISEEWEDIMKKKVFRERNEEPKKEVKIEKEEIKEEKKEEPKKKTTKKVK